MSEEVRQENERNMYLRVDFFAKEYRWNIDDVMKLTLRDTEMLYDIVSARREKERNAMPPTPSKPSKPTYSR